MQHTIMDWLRERWAALIACFGQGRRKREEQFVLERCGCVCYCPGCREVLQLHASVFEREDGSTEFKCDCGHRSRWLFDAPVPTLLR